MAQVQIEASQRAADAQLRAAEAASLGAQKGERERARRQRHTEGLAPFLAVLNCRSHQFGAVVGSARAGIDPVAFRSAVQEASSDELFVESAVMVLARRRESFAQALKEYVSAEHAAKDALYALAETARLTAESVAVDPVLLGYLSEESMKLPRVVADLDDAIDAYLDSPEAE